MKPWNESIFQKLMACIDGHLEKTGTAPTLNELASETGVPRSTAARYLKKMETEGRLVYEGCRRMETEKSRKRAGNTLSVPVLGRVACGLPKYAEENIEEYVALPQSWLGEGEFFALRADGPSMKNAGIETGDVVLVRRQNTAEPGQIVVALVDDTEATLKRYLPVPEKGHVFLVPENDDFDVQDIDLAVRPFAVQGVAVKVLKTLS